MLSIIVAFKSFPIITQFVCGIIDGNNEEDILKKIKEEILKVKGMIHLFFLLGNII